MSSLSEKIGVVAIGRNEGDRLIRSLDSVVREACPVVYVNSGSTDGSCEVARDRNVEVVELDMSVPFTAARARNAGFERLREKYPQVEYVQLIDGDWEVVPGWLEAAAETLDNNPDVVALYAWRLERYPAARVYNRICDVEWRSGSIGETKSCGKDVMIRAAALAAVGGYNPRVIAAEDDELGVRLGQNGGKLGRIDQNCTRHDADMHRLSQWWAKRCGYAYALVCHMHGALPERKLIKDLRDTWLWGLIVPSAALVLMIPTHGISPTAFGRYPLSAWRTIDKTQRQGFSWKDNIAWGLSWAMSVFPQAFGALKFHRAPAKQTA
ncbi:glycosyltransferase [Microseira wollei]|uniref:Glycosyl transferase family 2 n=1 Tax=Microseira wollei NIES-4236 TaxID=2530354 RepID=A0AAV3XG95_9CYAN|nr:glycosyltransferase family A protein [Microseira wollei]GET39412.1 glycosyl transferase family 2 [Microseira wollei NIES-4236]